MTLIGASVLMASTGGIKLVSDLQADGVNVPALNPEGGNIYTNIFDYNEIGNSTDVGLKIISISPTKCGNFPTTINLGRPDCSILTILQPNNGNSCIIDCRTLTIE